jgi:hypothetical protein
MSVKNSNVINVHKDMLKNRKVIGLLASVKNDRNETYHLAYEPLILNGRGIVMSS